MSEFDICDITYFFLIRFTFGYELKISIIHRNRLQTIHYSELTT